MLVGSRVGSYIWCSGADRAINKAMGEVLVETLAKAPDGIKGWHNFVRC